MTQPRGLESPVLAGESFGQDLDLTGRIAGDLDSLGDFAREFNQGADPSPLDRSAMGALPRRINAEPATVEKDLAKLVLALVDLVRQVVERQAVRRVNAGSLSDDEIERMGETFLRLDQRMAELKTAFRLQDEDLDLTLGPIGNLM